jgi:hypothetical protein
MNYQAMQELKAQAEKIDAPVVARINREFLTRCAAKHNVTVAKAAQERALRAVVAGSLSINNF